MSNTSKLSDIAAVEEVRRVGHDYSKAAGAVFAWGDVLALHLDAMPKLRAALDIANAAAMKLTDAAHVIRTIAQEAERRL